MEVTINLIPSLMLGIALSASSGLRIFVPLLISNLFAKFGILSLSENFLWMADSTTTIVFSIASLIEIASYYIPFIDNILDTIALPVSVVAGTVLTTQFLKIEDPVFRYGLGILAGGGAAATIQTGTSILRLGSSKLTAGFGNTFFSTFENIASLVFSLLAIWIPMFMGILTVLVVLYFGKQLFRKFVNS